VWQMLYRASVNQEAPSTKKKESVPLMNTFLLLFSGVAVTVILPCLIANVVRDHANRNAHLF
jgi:heme/copper-type cytochrome/quinol oxidase subunit 3